MNRRTPPGGRMGIPKCGGLHHGVLTEHLCFECQTLYNEEERNKLLKRQTDLLEEQLELEYRGYRRPRYAPPEPKPNPVEEPGVPPIKRRGS